MNDRERTDKQLTDECRDCLTESNKQLARRHELKEEITRRDIVARARAKLASGKLSLQEAEAIADDDADQDDQENPTL